MRTSTLLLSWFACVVQGKENYSLIEAVLNDDPEGVTKALKRGDNINEIGQGGQTPLMTATLRGSARAVKVLLAAGADTTIPENDGYTPMHGAGFQGRAEVARLLLAHGLDPNDRHRDGYTPLHRACWGRQQRHTEMVRVLLEAGVPPDQDSHAGPWGVDTNGDATGNKSPLEMTQREQTKAVIREFLKKQEASKVEL